MKIALLYRAADASENAFFIEKLIEGFKRRGVAAVCALAEEGLPYGFDAVIDRTPCADFAERLERRGIRTFNRARTARILNDKFSTYSIVKPMFPTVDTIICKTFDDALSFGFPSVIKNPSGRGGGEVWLVNDADGLAEAFKAGFIAQKYVADAIGDLRVYVLGNRVVASVLRRRGDDFRANVKRGGTAELFTPSDRVKNAAIEIATAVDADYIGVDFLIGRNREEFFNEAEDCAGARSLYALSDIDIADLFAKYVLKELKV